MQLFVTRTFAELLAGGYGSCVSCRKCRRAVKPYVEASHGHETFVRRRLRCTVCGELGHARLAPPTHADGFMSEWMAKHRR